MDYNRFKAPRNKYPRGLFLSIWHILPILTFGSLGKWGHIGNLGNLGGLGSIGNFGNLCILGNIGKLGILGNLPEISPACDRELEFELDAEMENGSWSLS